MNDNMQYFKRSWALLTGEKGWIKPVLVFAAVMCVPVVGSILGGLALFGYCLEWARLTAWGVDSYPKQRNVDIGACIGSGWRGFVVNLVWVIVLHFAAGVATGILSAVHLGFLGALLQIACLVVGFVGTIAALRAAIYQRIGAGFGVGQVWEMIKRDTNGFIRVLGLKALGGMVVGLIGILIGMTLLASAVPAFFIVARPVLESQYYGGGFTNMQAVQLMTSIFSLFGQFAPALAVVSFLVRIPAVILEMLSVTAAGLWFRQFNVAAWGSPSDPLPSAPSRQPEPGPQNFA